MTEAKIAPMDLTNWNASMQMIMLSTLPPPIPILTRGAQRALWTSSSAQVLTVIAFGKLGFVMARMTVLVKRMKAKRFAKGDQSVPKTSSGANDLVSASTMSKCVTINWIVLMEVMNTDAMWKIHIPCTKFVNQDSFYVMLAAVLTPQKCVMDTATV